MLLWLKLQEVGLNLYRNLLNLNRTLFDNLAKSLPLEAQEEQKKFDAKFKNLSSEKIELAKKQETYRELLSSTSVSKV